MLSYQHAYHAGGAADLHKHLALAALLEPLAGLGIAYVESHAGRGLYDLAAPEAAKTGEAAQGLGRLVAALPDGPPEGAFWNVLVALRARDGGDAYPGSPAVAASILGGEDSLTLFERHPAEYRALTASRGRLDAFSRGRAGPRIVLHAEDGHAALTRKGALEGPAVVLIDPSYEVKAEYATTAATALAAARAPGMVSVVVWYPILPDGRHDALVAPVTDALGPPGDGSGCLVHEVAFQDLPARGMVGSGILVLNPPPHADVTVERAMAPCAPVFAVTKGAHRPAGRPTGRGA
ncbi:MAG: 23S rRNA (adenine(2030)-N(6))-methyltransferase RlmJ [Pseudomonadota bacterium]